VIGSWGRPGHVGDVQLFFIDVSFMLCKVNPLSEYVGGFVHPVGVDDIVRHCIWHQPHTLLLLLVVWCVTKTYSNYVAFAAKPLDGCQCGGLRFFSRKIVDDKRCTNNVELGRTTRLLIACDGYNVFLIVELEGILDTNFTLGVWFGQYQELMRSPT